MPKSDISETAPGVTIRGAIAEQRLFGRYTLKRVLGRGGMGIVWLAHDDELKRSVAMKFLPDMIIRDREAVEDLKRETRRSLDLTHHHIVRIYDFTQDENSAAIIMEYVDGETLSAMKTQQSGGCFGVSTLSIWAGHFCQALDYAHRQARVVHRDLKPANLMVNSRGDLKITDFGISRSMSDSMTRVSMSNTAGTLAYMSPEQALGSPPAAADDIYAFGATMYDLLTGRPPFFRGNLQVQLETVVPPPMQARRAELGNSGEPVPALWEEVIAACLAKRPQDRPQSMAEIANLLGIGGPTTGYRPGTNLAFTPLTAALAPGTTRATQQAQPATTPTQQTLSPEEYVTQAQSGPGAAGANQAAVRPTSLKDVIPGYDFAREPERPAAAAPAPPAPEPSSAPAADVSEPAPELEVQSHSVAETPPSEVAIPEPAEPVEDSFPTIVPQPPGADIGQPAEGTNGAAEAQMESNGSVPQIEDDHFPTLRGESIEQIVDAPESDLQQLLPPQEAPSEHAPEPGVTLDEAPISAPAPPIEEQFPEEFPTFAGTHEPEAEAAAPVENVSQPLEQVVPEAPGVVEPPEAPEPAEAFQPAPAPAPAPGYAPHAFSAPPQTPVYAPPRKKSPLPLLLGLAAAIIVIAGAIWMAIPPADKPLAGGPPTPIPIPPVEPTPVPEPPPPPPPTQKELAQPFIDEGKRLLASDQLDAAVEQARLALEKNPGDPDATKLQQDIASRKNAMAEAAAAQKAAEEAARLVSEGNASFPRDLKNARAKAEEAQRKVPNYAPATALLTRISEREKVENQYVMALRGAQNAFDRKDYKGARAELEDVPDEFESSKEVTDLREDITRALASTPRPSQRNKISTPRPAPRTTPRPTRNYVEPVRNPSTPRPRAYEPPPPPERREQPIRNKPRPTPPRQKPPGTGSVIGG